MRADFPCDRIDGHAHGHDCDHGSDTAERASAFDDSLGDPLVHAAIESHRRLLHTRRQFFGRASAGIGVAALASLLGPGSFANAGEAEAAGAISGLPSGDPLATFGSLPKLHFAPKAKRVIYLQQNGGPSQLDLYDYKPGLDALRGTELPDSIRKGQRLTGMTSGQKSFPVQNSIYKFAQHGKAGTWFGELLPHTAGVADDVCVVRSMHTEAINHDPAITYLMTGSQQPGRPSFGSWASYGLGSVNKDLPSFIVLISKGSGMTNMQPLFARLWGSGFIPSVHQGVNFRAGADAVLYLNDPPGLDKTKRRRMLDAMAELNRMSLETHGDPEIETRIAQYEMAYRMQSSVPELTNVADEPEETFALYGEDARKPGTYAANCLLARRLAERGVRFIQLYHRGWDQHSDIPRDLATQCKDVDQSSAALVADLKRRGMLDETLVVWAGEFGRTVYSQGALGDKNYGRDHHGRAFTIWMAGGGIKPGMTWGETDDYGYNIVRDPVHVHDLNATMLHLMGVDHTKLTYRFQGRDFRLTDVDGHLVKGIMA